MLVIENRENLKGERLLMNTTDGYYIEGVYEYINHYQIHIRSLNKTIVDELLILKREKTNKHHGFVYDYYTLYDSNSHQRRVNVSKAQIKWKDMFLHNIELILKMK